MLAIKIKLNMIHTPTKLQTLCDKLKEKNMTILMRELTAKIRSDNSGYEEVVGRYGLGGNMNENDLADFCAFNNMIIRDGVFPHRRIYKETWVSSDHRTKNKIDHICIGRKFRRSMQDMRVQRGADATSNYHLVLARMKLNTTTTNNNDFFCANILEDQAQWRDKSKGVSKLVIESNA